ncbi:MAG TPA: alpha/beta hydrolase [Steroidobacteraceae bacterium]|nr:alpha/beta hydrolase [Steroidobacteraceae bacterium]
MLKPERVPLTVLLLMATASLLGCSGLGFFAANAPVIFDSNRRAVDLAYGQDARQRLDVYAPPGAAALPVVIFWYGGSWTHGDKSEYRFVAEALARQGLVVAIPDYRLFPGVKYPDFVQDGAHALQWVEQHAREYGGDPNRIVLMGHSAGAHMAAMLAFNRKAAAAAGADPRCVVGLVGLSGPYALDPNSDLLRTIFAAPYTVADWQPVRYVDDQSPPALLIHGLSDDVVYVSHAEKLHAALVEHHVRVEMQLYPERGHSDTVAAFSLILRRRTPALAQTVAFIRSVTTRSDPSH